MEFEWNDGVSFLKKVIFYTSEKVVSGVGLLGLRGTTSKRVPPSPDKGVQGPSPAR